jgi:hypothetical protein
MLGLTKQPKAVDAFPKASKTPEDVPMHLSEGSPGPCEIDDHIEPHPPMRPPSPLHPIANLTTTGRPLRAYRLPARYEDVHPEGPASIPTPLPLPQVAPGSLALPRVILHVRDFMRTGCNRFGLLREYPHRPSYDPDAFVPDEDLSNGPLCQPIVKEVPPSRGPPWPFRNMSTYLLMEWMNTGSNQKSIGEVDRLAKEVLSSKDFKLKDIAGFSARTQNEHFDASERHNCATAATPYTCDGWVESGVQISIPTSSRDNHGLGQPFVIPGLHHRSILGVLRAALADVTAYRFHFSPFKRFWKSGIETEERCFDEAYTSDAWIEAHDKLQKQTNEPDCKLEKVILGLMFWSDSTHLASFGTAKVWPLYLYIANLSKYFRGKPNSGAAHHIAYIPSVSNLSNHCHFRV